MRIVLASQSPRRKEIMEKLKIPFFVRTIQISEEVYRGEDPYDYVLRMAETKAAKIAELEKEALVIGADTIVCLEKEILGKPCDEEDAFRMLDKIKGKSHIVYTGVCMNYNNGEKIISFVEKTEVFFADMTRKEIQDYIRTGEPMDKAGAYGIQDKGAIFVKGIKGCFYNVMGLPIHRVYEELKKLNEGD